MSEEELEDLLGIGCCEYHIEIGKEAKKEIEKLKENNQAMQEEMARTWKKLDEKENIIKEVREEVRIYEIQSNDGTTNELDNYVFVQRLKNVLDKENK